MTSSSETNKCHSTARRFKDLEWENARLKKWVAELSLDKAMLKELASPSW